MPPHATTYGHASIGARTVPPAGGQRGGAEASDRESNLLTPSVVTRPVHRHSETVGAVHERPIAAAGRTFSRIGNAVSGTAGTPSPLGINPLDNAAAGHYNGD